jgi:hypothetical protein
MKINDLLTKHCEKMSNFSNYEQIFQGLDRNAFLAILEFLVSLVSLFLRKGPEFRLHMQNKEP